MTKPRIFIAMHYMEIGGAETALVGLLNALDPDRVDVDLFLHDHRGEMMQFIPKWVNLLPSIQKYTVLERPIIELIRRGYIRIAIARMIAKYISKWNYKRSRANIENGSGQDTMSRFTTPLLPKINHECNYDLSISFHAPHRIVLNKVNAKKRIAWIHTDYTRIWVDAKQELKIWQKYDYIASISRDVSMTFLKIFPSLADKIIEIENILSPEFVRRRADLHDVGIEMCGGGGKCLNIITIGRFSKPKNLDNVPEICRKMIEEHHVDVKWYIIGYGGDEQFVRQKIAEAGMEKHVIILGKRENPYPYIKACDIYVQPSRYEGKSVTVREAQILCKPVVVTNYPTASSQIQSHIDGVIVPMDNDGCAKGIVEVILNKDLQERLINFLKTHDYGNESEVEKIYALLGL